MNRKSSEQIVLLGAGGHARACIDVIEQEGRFSIAGLIGLVSEVGNSILGYPVLGSDDELGEWLARTPLGVVAVGQIKTPAPRMRLFDRLASLGRCAPPIVSPRAYISRHARVGAGSIVMHGAVINAGAVVGRNCIINSQSLIEHDTVIGDHCHVATGARLNSGVVVGDGTFIGSGSSVRQGARIGCHCVIGMAMTVLTGCADNTQLPPTGMRV